MTLCHGHHLRRGRHSSAGLTYLVTTVTHERRPIFQDFTAARLLIANMRRLQDEARLDSLAFVVMPDHLHWLLVSGQHRNREKSCACSREEQLAA